MRSVAVNGDLQLAAGNQAIRFKAICLFSSTVGASRIPTTTTMTVDRRGSVLGSISCTELNSRAGSCPLVVGPMSPWDACVCVIGVGYVGESLLKNFAGSTNCIGYDISETRIAALQSTTSSKNVQLTTDASSLKKGTHFVIAVPTPLREDHSVNLDYVTSAIKTIVAVARPGSVIVIESSVPVGTTRRLLGPYKTIFNCGMSPERIDPGRISPSAAQIPKIIAALTPKALNAIYALYALVFETLVPVSTPEVAEMTKLYENCYRMVNIAYVNEISDACRGHGIDPQEMISAASTKPFGFQPFYPGLGVGGHCIPVNPWYLLQNNKRLPVLQLATELMLDRPSELAHRFFADCVKEASGTPRILVVGLGFKKGQASLSGSPAVSFAKTLSELGCAKLAFFDPSIAKADVGWMEKLDDPYWTASWIDARFDAVALCNQSDLIDISVVDNLRNAYVRRFS